MCCKCYYIIFSTFSLKFTCKSNDELTHFKKMVRVWKTKSLLFCLRYDPLIIFRMQNHITSIFIKMMSHYLLVQMAYWGGVKHLPEAWRKLSRFISFFSLKKRKIITINNYSEWLFTSIAAKQHAFAKQICRKRKKVHWKTRKSLNLKVLRIVK